MKRTKITDGPSTLVDDTDYNISRSEAILRLHTGKNIIAQPIPDFSSDDIADWCPDAETLHAADYRHLNIDEIGNYLRSYIKFGIA